MPIPSDKKLKIAFMICSLVCFIQSGVCLIVDFALNRGVTWSAYPLLSVAFAWLLVAAVLLAPRHRAVFSLFVFSVLVFPYLYLLQTLTPVHGWFWPLAAPIAAVAVLSFWLSLYLIKAYRTRKLRLSVFLLILHGVFVSGAVRFFVSVFLHTSFFSFDIMIHLFACACVAAGLAIAGYARAKDNG